MTTTTERVPPTSPAADFRKPAPKSLSQWQLIARRFRRHRLAVGSIFVLLAMYSMAIFAEFVAPHSPHTRILTHRECPPQLPKLSFSHGLYVYAMRQFTDPVTLQKTYVVDTDDIVPLSFFAKGEPYRLWGMIPGSRHLIGVNLDAYRPPTPEAADVDLSEWEDLGDPLRPTFFFLGADSSGRDVLSRIIHGSRISLSIGLVAISVTFVLGASIGGISGYVGGALDNVIQRTIEIINAFPQLPLWLALGAILPTDWSPLRIYFGITIVLSLLGWTGLARVVRGKLLSLREEDYAVAARLLGAGHGRIIFRHLLPAFTSHIIVSLTLAVPGMILGETSLSFLGLGLRPPVVSWGVMLRDCMNMQVVANYPWLLLPVIFVIITVLSFNFLGDGMRDAADPYSAR